jgi:signal transduction histidine kinase
VSHELRTPLTSILGFARIVQKRLETIVLPKINQGERRVDRAVEQVRNNLAIMLVEGDRLTKLVNNVLDLEKIEAGQMVWNIAPLDVGDVVDQASSATESLYRQKGLEFRTEIARGVPKFLGDRDRVVQVLINLISNAVKFTDTGCITCRADSNEEARVVISISDTGCGIAPDDRKAVFEKFRQVGDTLTEKPAGTGLGLPICREIIDHLGGEITVESTPGRGSTFTFWLPAVRANVTAS